MMRKPPHPGFGIRDLIEDAGMGVTEAARKLGVTRQALNNLVNGRAGISPEMAIRLEKVFAGSAEQWLRIQTAYELAGARERKNEITQGLISLKPGTTGAVVRAEGLPQFAVRISSTHFHLWNCSSAAMAGALGKFNQVEVSSSNSAA